MDIMFRRIGCRYLQVFSEAEIDIKYIGVKPVEYPISTKAFVVEDAHRQAIYDTAVATLKLCMHDHYEDCPWREQALYTLDSRSQMLYGYYAFEDSFEYVKANLVLISKGQKADGSLPICFPSGEDLNIPFFGLIYVLQVADYVEHSGDIKLSAQLKTTLEKLLSFYKLDKNNLIKNFSGCWNFFEWSEGLSSATQRAEPNILEDERYALPLQCMAILAHEAMDKLYMSANKQTSFSHTAELIRKAVRKNFFDTDVGLFTSFKGEKHFSKLSNALAILSGCAAKDAPKICNAIADSSSIMSEATLSMKFYVYQALLTCGDIYKEYILKDIDETYSYMLRCGATSFWETIKGESDFGGAGSLCHGWSALPVYFYTKLLTHTV